MAASPLLFDEAQPTGGVVIEEPPPLITGETPYLVAGLVATLTIFVLIMVLIGRWRVNRRVRAAHAADTDFFKPAGEGAEITFDEMESRAAEALAAPVELPEPDFVTPAPPEPALEKKKSGFSFGGMFKKKETPLAEFLPESDGYIGDTDGLATVRIERQEPVGDALAFDADAEDAPARIPDWATIEREDRLRIEREEEERSGRLREAEESARRAVEEERRRAAEQEVQARTEELERRRLAAAVAEPRIDARVEPRAAEFGHAAHDDIVRTLSEVEEALHAQREAIQAETRALLDGFARRFSERLDVLAQTVERRSAPRFVGEGGPSGARSDANEIADLIGRRLDEHREQVAQSLSALSRRLDLGGARGDAASPVVQLADIVRDALPPGAYEMNSLIANNRRADCLVRLSFPPGPIAIDAKFPVEAFHALHQAGQSGESEFRRVALRHMVDIAERLIAHGVTADSAMMFIPSESMYSELHVRFPEVVQDSYRARVWIVSPTTLMATLHTLSAVTREMAPRANSFSVHSDAQRALAEIDRLRERVAALEKSGARETAAPMRPSTPAPAEGHASARRFGETHHGGDDAGAAAGGLYDDDRLTPAEAQPARPSRPPFPLR